MSSGQIRDFVLLHVNGGEHRIRGEQATMQLADYLRVELGLCGTKVVCAEGDCGACTVLVGRPGPHGSLAYKPLNSCIQALYQLDCAHVVTVEGLTPVGCELSPIQQAMVDCHGAQCGYCTPGFVVSLTALFDEHSRCANTVSRQTVKDALTGNLCRCTGYESIIKSALQCRTESLAPIESIYDREKILRSFAAQSGTDVMIETDRVTVFIPHELESAVQFKQAHPGTVIVSGGTDVCVNINKRSFRPRHVLSICNLSGLEDLCLKENTLIVGARVTLEQLADFMKDAVPEFFNILWVFGAPQVRYAGTLAGNIANGSPIADTLPFLFVMEAEVEVSGVHGSRRIPICSLYTGYKTLDMASDEIITRIFIPLPAARERLRLFKVSKREHLDISSLAAAVLLGTESRGGGRDGRDNHIAYARLALGGVAPTVLRMPETESFLQGKDISLATFEKAGDIALQEIAPISDVRGSSDFRRQLAQNILLKFYCSIEEPESPESLCAV